MNKPVVRKLRCAVYTRKSSEEGLEQEFNRLHAQREACESYIASQRSEGWVLEPFSLGWENQMGELPAKRAIVS